MKKISNFIIEKRYYILGLFIIITIFSLFMIPKVNINSDLTRYLPDSSETKMGYDIMDDEFEEEKSSSINIMFKDLSEEDKISIFEQLKQVENVSSVNYDNSENYNKDDYTLYELNIKEYSDSQISKTIYDNLKKQYKDYEVYYSGSVIDSNTPVLDSWVIIVAVTLAFIILIIMSESYFEPVIFFMAIGSAVAINMGTNIIFNSVSMVTNSICSILQLALSMDYSIMLMSRFRQEKKKNPNSKEAMKKALRHSFGAISSSSITTMVGLLALVFMSFTLGKDLGIVLAKGVLLSLVCIFLMLPSLILLFEKIIIKTPKKSFKINLTKLGNFSYKVRHIGLALLIIIFIGSYILKGNINILYTASENDVVGSIFKENNQMVIIYNNEDEQRYSEYCSTFEDSLCYGNTINQKLKYNEFNAKIADLGINDTSIDEYMLKIIYYNYFNKNNNKISVKNLVSFLENDKNLDINISDISKLNDFIYNVDGKKTISELSNIYGISTDDVTDLLIYYYSFNNNTSLTISQLTSFLKQVVLKNETYSSYIDKDMQKDINLADNIINNYNKKLTINEMSNLLNLDTETLDKIYMYYFSINGVEDKLSIYDFTSLMINMGYGTTDIKTINTFTNPNINIEMNNITLSNLFSIDINSVNNILQFNSTTTMTPKNFINYILSNPSYFDTTIISNLTYINNLMNLQENYSYQQMSNILGIQETNVKSLYALSTYKSQLIKPSNLISFMLNNTTISESLNKDQINKLSIFEDLNKKYTADNLSTKLNINNSDLKLIYSLYSYNYINKNLTSSVKDFNQFILDKVLTNDKFKSKFTSDEINKISSINTIINNNDKLYNSNDMKNLLSVFSNKLTSDRVELIYIYYNSMNNYNNNYSLTLEEIINYTSDSILTDNRFSDYINSETKEKIENAKEDIETAKNLLVGKEHSRIVLNTKLEQESSQTFEYVKNIKNNLNNAYLIGNSPMAYEMSKTFASELNFISIITMIAIFIVVALTFKSIVVPLILVLTIQSAVYAIMSIITLTGGEVFYIALIIVQSILMGATIDYAILYTSYYKEARKKHEIKESVGKAYNKSLFTILTSSSILIIVTFILGNLATGIVSMICKVIAEGTLLALLLVLFVLPPVIASCDKFVIKKNK